MGADPNWIIWDRGWSGALLLAGCPDTESQTSTPTLEKTARFAYVANLNSDNVSAYTINQTTGVLTVVGTVSAGTSPVSVAVDPTGRFAYVVNNGSNDVSVYMINQTTGALMAVGTPATTGSGPNSIALASF